MLNKPEFITLANECLFNAVEQVSYDLQPDMKLSEPAYTAAIVTKFPLLMNRRWNGAKFGGCFIHQSPYIKMNHIKRNNQCEVGDLLCVCQKTVKGTKRINAALFQLKKDKSKTGKVRPDNLRQLRLYTKWPEFSFIQDLHLTGENHYDIQPKAVTPGAQYMFINKYPYLNGCCSDFGCCMGYPVMFTHAIPEPVIENSPSFSFGSFLWDFIHWQNGRPISDSIENSKDDWSKLIWELIERSKKHVFYINKGKANELKAQRCQGDTIGFLTKMTLGLYDDISYQELLLSDHSHFDESHSEGKIKSESAKSVDIEGCDGISLLFIDLDGQEPIHRIEDERN